MVKRELKTGFLIGLICMVVITGLVYIFYSNLALGLIVGFSILLTLGISAVIGAIVPLIINKLKFDPAIASGPFITTLNDIIGLLIYFSIATTLIEFLWLKIESVYISRQTLFVDMLFSILDTWFCKSTRSTHNFRWIQNCFWIVWGPGTQSLVVHTLLIC